MSGIPGSKIFHSLVKLSFAASLGVRRLGTDRCGLVLPFRTRAGLVLRAVGESPQSALRWVTRYCASDSFAVLFGALLGCGGCLFVVGLYAALGRRHDGRPRVDCIGTGDFATWRPLRVVVGAYLFGGVTMLQFAFQGDGHFHFAAVHGNDALSRDDSRACADFRNPAWIRLNVPASLGKPFSPKRLRTSSGLTRCQEFSFSGNSFS